MTTHPLIPFGLLPPDIAPGWHRPGAGGWLLYRGQAGADAIDWTAPVGFAQAAAATITAGAAAAQPATVHHYGLRAVSDAGVQEHNTHVLCSVRQDVPGEPPRAVLPRPDQVQLVPLETGQTLLAWRLLTRPGQARPERVELLAGDDAGGWRDEPVAAADVLDDAAEYAVPLPERSGQWALRVRLGDTTETHPAPVAPPAQPPAPPRLL